MLSIFIEASCNRYERDECIHCHVFEPLNEIPKTQWHLTPGEAQIMADKIREVKVLHTLARQEINLTGGEATMNPHVVEIFKIFRAVTPNVCLHTNLEIGSFQSRRWKDLVTIIKLSGRVDITLYPTAWERYQKPLLTEVLALQKRLLTNVVFESLADLKNQLEILLRFFEGQGAVYTHVATLIGEYHRKVTTLLEKDPHCREADYTRHMGETGAFAGSDEFVFGINLLPAFDVDEAGRRAMTSLPFRHDFYLLECPAARGSIDIMTVQQNGDMTPCCDVGNLKCRPKFGNLLQDSAQTIMEKFEKSRQRMMSGIRKNRENLLNSRAGTWVEEGIPPYCQ